MLAIYKRELKSYFRSFIGFLFIAVTPFFLGLYFSVYNLMNGYPYFAYVVSKMCIRDSCIALRDAGRYRGSEYRIFFLGRVVILRSILAQGL